MKWLIVVGFLLVGQTASYDLADPVSLTGLYNQINGTQLVPIAPDNYFAQHVCQARFDPTWRAVAESAEKYFCLPSVEDMLNYNRGHELGCVNGFGLHFTRREGTIIHCGEAKETAL